MRQHHVDNCYARSVAEKLDETPYPLGDGGHFPLRPSLRYRNFVTGETDPAIKYQSYPIRSVSQKILYLSEYRKYGML